MAVDINEFFRKATIQICRNLEFEKALQECLLYLRSVMPADIFFLVIYKPELKALKMLANASLNHVTRTERIIPLAEASIQFLEKQKEKQSFITGSDNGLPIAKTIAKVTGIKEEHSAMVMHLRVKSSRPGNLILLANGKEQYSKKHLELFTLLNDPFTIALSNTLRFDELNRLKDIMADDIRFLRQKLNPSAGEAVVGEDFGLKEVMTLARRVSPIDSPVLVTGETGVGKEIVANAIHQASRRKNGPFIKVNCGAIPDTLIDSELFGHEKGAFTGAISQKRGCFERAAKGTIFLDEVAELPLPAQVRMLRVLQDKKIIRVGGTEEIDVDIRIIAATHQDLGQMVEKKLFRSDLWFRLNVFPITIPPLRERTEDIPALVNLFIANKAKELGFPRPPKIEPGAIDTLKKYDWPGNVRELENVVERVMILNREGPLSFDNILGQHKTPKKQDQHADLSGFIPLDLVNKTHIIQALKLTDGKIHGPNGAAKLLGLNPSTVRFRIRKLGIIYKK